VASAFAHAVAGASLWPFFRSTDAPRHLWLAGAALAVVPDADVAGYFLGVPYDSPLGHRGLTHSAFFAAVAAAAALAVVRGSRRGPRAGPLFTYLFLATLSHGVLDAMTSGGGGVAFFAPFWNERYFLPWRPILVSPLGVRAFFTPRGVAVLRNEAVWVGLPSLLVAAMGAAVGTAVSAARPRVPPPDP
jgi:inner membrane protein